MWSEDVWARKLARMRREEDRQKRPPVRSVSPAPCIEIVTCKSCGRTAIRAGRYHRQFCSPGCRVEFGNRAENRRWARKPPPLEDQPEFPLWEEAMRDVAKYQNHKPYAGHLPWRYITLAP